MRQLPQRSAAYRGLRRPVRVLWIIKGLGLGGAETLLALTARHVNRDQFQHEAVFFLPWKTALVYELERHGVPTTCLNHVHPFDLRIVVRLARIIRERRIDIVHAHLPYSGVVGRVAARLARVPCVYTEHSLQEHHHTVSRLTNQSTMWLCDRVIAVSEEVRRSVLHSPLARWARIVVIRNGVDVERLLALQPIGPAVRQELSISPDRLIVGVVSSFRPPKRLDLWIRAARLIADAEPRSTFLMIGEGTGRPETMALADRLGLNGRIMFTGLRPDAPRLMTAFDVFMLSSDTEGLPVSALEAMALGKPVVATRVGGLSSLIGHGEHGFLVPPGDVADLASKSVELLKSPALRHRMGEASQRRVEKKFSIRQMVRDTEHIYLEVLDQRRGSPGQ